MSDRPILFSAPMVRALLAGTKTQTRRTIKLDTSEPVDAFLLVATHRDTGRPIYEMRDRNNRHIHLPLGKGLMDAHFSPRFAKGDRLWVREAFVTGFNIDDEYGRPIGERKVWYRATDSGMTWLDPDTESTLDNPPWKPSIHMPREFSRLTLTVADVRIERLQDISEADAIAEDCRPFFDHGNSNICTGPNGTEHKMAPLRGPIDAFEYLWNLINGPGSWEQNPWVVAVTFGVHQSNIDALPARAVA